MNSFLKNVEKGFAQGTGTVLAWAFFLLVLNLWIKPRYGVETPQDQITASCGSPAQLNATNQKGYYYA